MRWPWRKPKKLNETTRLYALYGESANLEYLDNQDKETIQRVEVVENNLQQTNQNLNQTNQNLTQTNNKVNGLENRLNNLPQSDVTKQYVDMQDGLLRGEIAIAQGTANSNEKEIQKTNSGLSNLADRVVDLALEHKTFAKKDAIDSLTTELRNEVRAIYNRIDLIPHCYMRRYNKSWNSVNFNYEFKEYITNFQMENIQISSSSQYTINVGRSQYDRTYLEIISVVVNFSGGHTQTFNHIFNGTIPSGVNYNVGNAIPHTTIIYYRQWGDPKSININKTVITDRM